MHECVVGDGVEGVCSSLNRAHLPLVSDTGEVVALTVLARDLAKVTGVADALASEALVPLAADGLALPGAALVLLGGAVVLLRALALGPQPAGCAAAHPTLKRPVAVVAAVAVRLGLGLAGTVAVERDLDGKAVFEAHGLDGEGLLLLLGSVTHLGLNAEAHLNGR